MWESGQTDSMIRVLAGREGSVRTRGVVPFSSAYPLTRQSGLQRAHLQA
jgi:hypothetical protein